MQATRATNFPASGANEGRGQGLSPFIPILLLAVGGFLVWRDPQSGVRLVFALGVFLLLSGLSWRANPMAGGAILAFLCLLGGIRRFLILDFGWSAMDPLVLVAPILSILSFTSMAVNRQIKRNTPLSGTLYWLLIVMGVQILNPRQGGLMVGVGGILFYIAPLMWFYLGKRIATPYNISILCRVAQGAAVFGALYGYKQRFIGFSEAEEAWLKTAAYVSLYISADAIRAFSFFTSMQEYALFLSVGIVLAFGQLMRKNAVALIPFFIQIPALFLSGGRGPIVLTILACCVMWAIQSPRKQVWFPRLATSLVLGFVGLAWSLSQADTSTLDAGTAGLLNHQKEGLLDPSNSTATKHADLVSGGILAGIKNPVGYGLGSTTTAAVKFGGEGLASEMDFSNLFISLGVVGGVLYLIVMYRVLMECGALWQATRDYHFQLFIGVFVVLFGQWLNGNLYAICFFVWFIVGYIDKQYAAMTEQRKSSPSAGGQRSHRTAPLSAGRDPRQASSRSNSGFGGRRRRVQLRH